MPSQLLLKPQKLECLVAWTTSWTPILSKKRFRVPVGKVLKFWEKKAHFHPFSIHKDLTWYHSSQVSAAANGTKPEAWWDGKWCFFFFFPTKYIGGNKDISAFCKRLGAHSFAEVTVLKCGVFLIAWLKGLPPNTEMFSLGNFWRDNLFGSSSAKCSSCWLSTRDCWLVGQQELCPSTSR